ncbi:hypothetical protein ACFC06_26945 [Nocardia sp. NPDC056064]|uniref:hypothetical protein n=1 Tax=Nocardia sp. NPDC056064 TaxID=3345701 RepID=UPI0035DC320A
MTRSAAHFALLWPGATVHEVGKLPVPHGRVTFRDGVIVRGDTAIVEVDVPPGVHDLLLINNDERQCHFGIALSGRDPDRAEYVTRPDGRLALIGMETLTVLIADAHSADAMIADPAFDSRAQWAWLGGRFDRRERAKVLEEPGGALTVGIATGADTERYAVILGYRGDDLVWVGAELINPWHPEDLAREPGLSA